MRVERGGGVVAGAEAAHCEAAGLRVWWRGFAYVPGHASGAPSIERFAARAAREGVPAAAVDLRGLYLAIVADAGRQATYAFVDPSGLFHAHWSADGVDDDFLALARAGGRTAADLDPDGVAELVLQGLVAFGRTPFASIRELGADDVVALPRDGTGPRVHAKPQPRLDERPPLGLLAQLERLVPALAGHRLSVDLTGGMDTRLVAVALAHLGVAFETDTSGSPDSDEVRFAQQVAAGLGRPHHVHEHRPDALAGELDELLLGSGCVVDPLLSQRELQLMRARAERGIDLVVHGFGGELFRDYWWLQDFPRYRGRRADLDRLFRLRIARAHARPAPLAGAYADAAGRLAARFVERLEPYRMATNTETYDAVLFCVRWRDGGGRALTSRSRVIPTFAPLLDRDAARLGFCLPRRTRFFNGASRRIITGLSPEVARLPTTEGGLSASSEASAVPLDTVRWTVDKARRVVNKSLPARYRPPATGSPLPPLYRRLRALPVLDASVARLRDAGILAAGAGADDLGDGQLGGAVALARLIEELER